MQKLIPISESQVSPLKAGRTTYFVNIPADTPVEAILQPTYWANVTERIHLRNHIEADWQDGSKLIVLRVVGVGPDHVKVKVMNEYRFDIESKVVPLNDFRVEYIREGSRAWSIIRKSTNEYIKDGLNSRDEANLWLQENMSKIAA